MNDDLKETLLWRATIVENLDSLIKSCSHKDKNQLSLFEETKNDTINMNVPENINYEEMINKEIDVLGVSLSYNVQDRYILHHKRFCNQTLRTIDFLEESASKLIFIAQVVNIEYKTSNAENKYAKIYLRDSGNGTRMYLFGKSYIKYISKVFKGGHYLFEATYNKDRESLSIDNVKSIDDIDIKDYVSTIVLEINDGYKVAGLRNYVFTKMIGGNYNVIYLFKGEEFEAPYKIKFNENHYSALKNFIDNIDVRK